MKLSQVLRVGSYTVVVAMLAQTSAMADRHIDRYDTIETKQIGLKQEINTELQAGKITSADRKVLLKMMQTVNEHKKRMQGLGDEALAPDDKKQLDFELNEVSQ